MINIATTEHLGLTQFDDVTEYFDPINNYSVDMKKIDDWSKNVPTDTNGTAYNALQLNGKTADQYAVIKDNINWTPVLCGATTIGTPTYTTQIGIAYRNGNECYIYGKIALSAKNDMDGLLEIDGLPFSAEYNSHIDIITYSGISDLSGVICPYAEANNTKIFIGQSCSNTGTALDVTATKITDVFTIEFSGKYLTTQGV